MVPASADSQSKQMEWSVMTIDQPSGFFDVTTICSTHSQSATTISSTLAVTVGVGHERGVSTAIDLSLGFSIMYWKRIGV